MSTGLRHDIAYLIILALALACVAAIVILRRSRRQARRETHMRIDLGARSDKR